MKILPTMCKAIVFVHENGKTFEMTPFQTFIAGGQTLIRIGNNMIFFDRNGRLDGTESKVGGFPADSPEAAIIREAFEVQGKYKGLAPEVPYFMPGAPGHEAETRAWASAKQEDGGQMYVAAPKSEHSLRDEMDALLKVFERARELIRDGGVSLAGLAAAVAEYEEMNPSTH